MPNKRIAKKNSKKSAIALKRAQSKVSKQAHPSASVEPTAYSRATALRARNAKLASHHRQQAKNVEEANRRGLEKAKHWWQAWRTFAKKKVHEYPREIPPRMMIKATAILMIGPLLLLFVLVFYGHLELEVALWSLTFLFCISLVFIRPYIGNLSALTNYVRALSRNAKAEAPDLSFLNNVQELQQAVEDLHKTWEFRGRELQALVEESNVLINSLPDILIMLDEKFTLLRTNLTARTVFGSRTFKDIISNIIESPEIREAGERVLEEGKGRDMLFYLQEPFTRHYMVHIEPFPKSSPSQIALLIVMHDITRQKATEQMLTDFVANASHEIRTPLTAVMGYIETLQTVAKDDTDARERFLIVMKNQTDRMAKLIKDLLSLSQIERTIHSRPHELVHIGNLLKDVQGQAIMDAEAREKHINVVLDIPARKLPKIEGDADQLRQVFDNLIGNALKYGKADTAVDILAEVKPNTFEETILKEADHVLCISVHDEGEGIPPEHIPRLTERFYRVDTARSRKIGGSGLGLAIVKQILERHHGTLHIESMLGEGSTFTVILPVPEEEVLRMGKKK